LAEELPLRRKVARLSVGAVVLLGLSLVLLAVAVVVAVRGEPKVGLGRLPAGIADGFPSLSFALAAVAAAAGFCVGLAALYAAAAMRVLARDRRIPEVSPEMRKLGSALLTPLGPAAVRVADELPLPPGKLPDEKATRPPLRLTVLVPAHNEALTIKDALASLWGQTRPPDRVVVVADNCSDDTAEIAHTHGAEVFTTVANTDMKAGALNQALAEMDADSTLVPEFLETAMGRLEADPDLMAVGGVFYGEQGAGLVGQLQRNEYARYQRDISRQKGRVFVLTGTASLFRTYALKAVATRVASCSPAIPAASTTRWPSPTTTR
jgi:biofilm PGA synthesis N-glycosyltransferase PgaC